MKFTKLLKDKPGPSEQAFIAVG